MQRGDSYWLIGGACLGQYMWAGEKPKLVQSMPSLPLEHPAFWEGLEEASNRG